MPSLYHSVPHITQPRRDHPGSTEDEIINEPDWRKAPSHRVGFRNRDNRPAGYIHHGHDWDDDELHQFLESAKEEADELRKELKAGDLLTVRDIMTKQEACSTYTDQHSSIELC